MYNRCADLCFLVELLVGVLGGERLSVEEVGVAGTVTDHYPLVVPRNEDFDFS